MTTPDATSIENTLGRVLGIGSAVSTFLLGMGLLATIVLPGPTAGGLMRIGLIILLATPIARVMATTVVYVRARDWTSVFMTGAVLLVLMGSVAVALGR